MDHAVADRRSRWSARRSVAAPSPTRWPAETQAAIDDAKAEYPQIQGKSLIFAYLTTTDLSTVGVYAPQDPRVSLMNDLGLVNAPMVDDVDQEGAVLRHGLGRAGRRARVRRPAHLVGERQETWRPSPTTSCSARSPPSRRATPTREEDKHVSLAVTNPTPLSIPYTIEHFLPQVAEAVDGT